MAQGGQPAVRVRLGEVPGEALIASNKTAAKIPYAVVRIEIAALEFVVETTLSDVARRVQQVVIRGQIQIQGQADIRAAAAVAAQGGKQQPGLPSIIQRKAHPGRVKHRVALDAQRGVARDANALLQIEFELPGAQQPVLIARGAKGHGALFDADQLIGIARQPARPSAQMLFVEHEVAVFQLRRAAAGVKLAPFTAD